MSRIVPVEIPVLWNKKSDVNYEYMDIPGLEQETEDSTIVLDFCDIVRFNEGEKKDHTTVDIGYASYTILMSLSDFKDLYEKVLGLKIISYKGETVINHINFK